MGGLVGVFSQKAIGWSISATASFTPVFVTGSIMYPIAFLLVCLLVKRLGEVRIVRT
jgi:nitrate/nitrite transporter NarK